MEPMVNKPNKVLEGHRLQASLLRQELLWLYTLFAAMKPAMIDAAMIRGSVDGADEISKSEPIAKLYEDYFETEVTRLLVQTATTLRMMDEHAGLDLGNACFRVGTLIKDEATGPLNLREATNKIIHLDVLRFDYQYIGHDEENRKAYKDLRIANPNLTLVGTTQTGKPWQAKLVVDLYVRHALIAAELYGAAKNRCGKARTSQVRERLLGGAGA
jgi:hypothetical protein